MIASLGSGEWGSQSGLRGKNKSKLIMRISLNGTADRIPVLSLFLGERTTGPQIGQNKGGDFHSGEGEWCGRCSQEKVFSYLYEIRRGWKP